jgi:hypothetical protein
VLRVSSSSSHTHHTHTHTNSDKAWVGFRHQPSSFCIFHDDTYDSKRKIVSTWKPRNHIPSLIIVKHNYRKKKRGTTDCVCMCIVPLMPMGISRTVVPLVKGYFDILEYPADALRMYLKFCRQGSILPLYNAFRFFLQNIERWKESAVGNSQTRQGKCMNGRQFLYPICIKYGRHIIRRISGSKPKHHCGGYLDYYWCGRTPKQ